MKKVFSLFLVCVCLVLSGCVLKDAAILYSERTEKDGFEIAVNKTGKTCFVGEYVCDEYTEDKEIKINNSFPFSLIGIILSLHMIITEKQRFLNPFLRKSLFF